MSPDSSPVCEIPTVTFNSSHLAGLNAYPLSIDTLAVFGRVGDAEDNAIHTLAPQLVGRRALVYFTDDPSRYEVVKSSAKTCVLEPAGPNSEAKGPPIHIDPRALSDPLQQLPEIRAEDVPLPEPTDAGSRAQKRSSGSFPQKPAGGSNINRKGKDKQQGVGNPGDQQRYHPASHESYNKGIEDALQLRSKLPPVAIGATEFLAYAPHHTRWWALAYRLIRNGWTTSDIAKAQLRPRGRLTRAEFTRRRNALRHQQRTAVLARYPGFTPTSIMAGPHQDFQPFTVDPNGNINLYDVQLPLQNSGTPPVFYEAPYNLGTIIQPPYLAELLNGVDLDRLPTGQDEGQLTKALRWASNNGQFHNLTVLDVPGIIQQQNLTAPAEANTTRWDILACARVRGIPNPP